MKEKTGVVLPYGRHKGRDVADVPAAYLRWFLANCKAKYLIKQAIWEYLHQDVHQIITVSLEDAATERFAEIEAKQREVSLILSQAIHARRKVGGIK